MTNTLFTSKKNYMKRTNASGSYFMLGPATPRFSASYYSGDKVIPHGAVGANGAPIVPMFRLFYEPFQDNKIIECFNDTQDYFSNPINTYGGGANGPVALVWADTVNITIRLYFTDTTLANINFPLYLVVYNDFGML